MNATPRSLRHRTLNRLGLATLASVTAVASTLAARPALGAEAKLVKTGTGTLVLSNANFSLEEYRALRAGLEREGLEVQVAAATMEPCVPWGGSTADAVQPDLPLSAVDPSRSGGIVFVGGWGASSYQYAFPGTYSNPVFRPDPLVAETVNRLIGAFLSLKKPVGGVCHGVTVLAWARVDGVSPLRGKTVSAWAGGGPGFELAGRRYPDATVPDRWHIERNGAAMPLSSAVGDPTTPNDDVVVDGLVYSGESGASIAPFARSFAGGVRVAAGDL